MLHRTTCLRRRLVMAVRSRVWNREGLFSISFLLFLFLFCFFDFLPPSTNVYRPLHAGFIDAVADRIETGLQEFDEADRHKVVILFSAHSVPMKVVNKGTNKVQRIEEGSTTN